MVNAAVLLTQECCSVNILRGIPINTGRLHAKYPPWMGGRHGSDIRQMTEMLGSESKFYEQKKVLCPNMEG